MLRVLLRVAGCLIVAGFVGCSGQSPPANIEGGDSGASDSGGSFDRDFPFVVRQEADFYKSGPQQGAPPDGTLPAGTAVKVLRQTGGYWLVESQAGVTGYVDSQSISDPATEGALP